MFFQKLFHPQNNKIDGIHVIVMSREKIEEIEPLLPKNACVISISTPQAGHLLFHVPVLYLDFPDTESDNGMTKLDADKVSDFVIANVRNGHSCIYVHCDQGISRSAGVAAAILRAYGKDEGQILDCSDYCINSRCYELVLKSFGIYLSKEEISEAKQRSRSSYMRSWPML